VSFRSCCQEHKASNAGSRAFGANSASMVVNQNRYMFGYFVAPYRRTTRRPTATHQYGLSRYSRAAFRESVRGDLRLVRDYYTATDDRLWRLTRSQLPDNRHRRRLFPSTPSPPSIDNRRQPINRWALALLHLRPCDLLQLSTLIRPVDDVGL
jgi:hypothetical protein